MQRLEVFPPGEVEMVIAPFTSDRQIQLITARPLERPAIGLNRPLQEVERVESSYLLVVDMHHAHKARSSHKTKQSRSKLAQDLDKTRV